MLMFDLGLTEAQFAQMTHREYTRWLAWYNVRAEKEEKARKDAEKKAKRKKGPRGGPPPGRGP